MTQRSAKPLVVIVEDEPDLQSLLTVLLSRANYDTAVASSGAAAIRTVFELRPDLVLLDVGLPDLDGWAILAEIRASLSTPVIMLTAHGNESDKVLGLSSGADDYLVKPFSNAELMARITAALRRAPTTALATTDYVDDHLKLNVARRTVTVGDHESAVTPIEFRVLTTLTANAGRVLSAEELMEQAWDATEASSPGRVKFTILRLRRKFDWDQNGPITSVRGFGYCYDPSFTREASATFSEAQ
jgi:DNA-binding response OmpR family regulator